MASNNKEFQEYLDTFDDPNKHRDLLWDCWIEATRVAEEVKTSHNSARAKCLGCSQGRVDCSLNGVVNSPFCNKKYKSGVASLRS